MFCTIINFTKDVYDQDIQIKQEDLQSALWLFGAFFSGRASNSLAAEWIAKDVLG